MQLLQKWYAAFDGSETMLSITDTLFRYLPQPLRARMPHHIATYLLIAAVCLVLSFVVAKPARINLADAVAVLAVTAVCVGLTLVLAIPLWGDPAKNLARAIRGFGEVFADIGGHFAPFQPLGLLGDLFNILVLIVSVLLHGLLVLIPAAPTVGAIYAEIKVFKAFSPVAFIGHSMFAVLVVAAIGVGYMVLLAALMPVAVVVGLLCVFFFI